MTPNIDLAERLHIIAANINRGQDTYAGRLDAWHALGAVSGTFQTFEEISLAAKARFFVFKAQSHDPIGRPIDAWGTYRVDYADVLKYKNGEISKLDYAQRARFLGTVGKDYGVLQTENCGNVLDALVGAIGGAHYETMGVLDYGATVWAQVDPHVDIRVGDDVSKCLVTFHTSHDGSRKTSFFATAVRMVCRNTVRAGLLSKLGTTASFVHRRGIAQHVADMTAEVQEIRTTAATMEEKLNVLNGRVVTRESMTTIMDRLFPKPAANEDGTTPHDTKRANVLADVLKLYEDNDANAFPEQRGTAYNLLNAITGYVDHERGNSKTTTAQRAESATFGTGATLKQSALDLIIAESANMPAKRVIGQSVPGSADVIASMLLTPRVA